MDRVKVRSTPGKGTAVTMTKRLAHRVGGAVSVWQTPLSCWRRPARGDNDACTRILEENAGHHWGIIRRYYGRGVGPGGPVSAGVPGIFKSGAGL